MQRAYTDPHPWIRCAAIVTLRDKTTAQCGKYRDLDGGIYSHLCAQHGKMKWAGKTVRTSLDS